MEKPYPVSLNKPPLMEMIVEIRFTSSLPDEALFGLYYPILQKYFSNHAPLPIMNMPLEARTSDPSLMIQPHYIFSNDSELSLQIGPRVLSFRYDRFRDGKEYTYPGWRNFISNFVSELTNKILPSIQIKSIDRIGIRYLDLLEDIKLRDYITPIFSFPNRDQDIERFQVTCSIREENILHNINLSDSADYKHRFNEKIIEHKVGSLIDIDSEYSPEDYNDFLAKTEEILTLMHDGNKNLFYEIMKKELVDMYEPQKG